MRETQNVIFIIQLVYPLSFSVPASPASCGTAELHNVDVKDLKCGLQLLISSTCLKHNGFLLDF